MLGIFGMQLYSELLFLNQIECPLIEVSRVQPATSTIPYTTFKKPEPAIPKTTMPLTGHCNCKAVTITVDDSKYTTESESSLKSIYCHCTTCKRQSGASGTFVIIADDNEVKIDDPKGAMKSWKDTLTDSGTPLDRNFCGICGW